MFCWQICRASNRHCLQRTEVQLLAKESVREKHRQITACIELQLAKCSVCSSSEIFRQFHSRSTFETRSIVYKGSWPRLLTRKTSFQIKTGQNDQNPLDWPAFKEKPSVRMDSMENLEREHVERDSTWSHRWNSILSGSFEANMLKSE